MENISNGQRAYVSVDDGSLSYVISQKFTGIGIREVKG